MKKIALAGLIVISASLLTAAHSEADRGGRGHGHGHRHVHGRVFIGVGPGYWWGGYPYPYWYYPPPYAVYSPPPVVVQESPPVYIEQPTPGPAAPPAAASESFWYYCQSVRGYYPSVPSCPEAWLKVAPRP